MSPHPHIRKTVKWGGAAVTVLWLEGGCAQMTQQPLKNSEPAVHRKEAAMDKGCCMSFRELFSLARKRTWTADEERQFKALDQGSRNRLVKELAAEAGCVGTEDRRGTDGVIYTAFWVEQRPPQNP